jgi:hypothetical protein
LGTFLPTFTEKIAQRVVGEPTDRPITRLGAAGTLAELLRALHGIAQCGHLVGASTHTMRRSAYDTAVL